MSRIRITLRGWPWQKTSDHWANQVDRTVGETWGWNPLSVKGMGRFGGGWGIKLGVDISASLTDWCIYLGIGMVRVTLKKTP